MASTKAKFERNLSLELSSTQKHVDQGKANVNREHPLDTSGNGNDVSERADDSSEEAVPDIKDIYDYIYGNVQSKLEFYESKRSVQKRPRTPVTDSAPFENFNDSSSDPSNSVTSSIADLSVSLLADVDNMNLNSNLSEIKNSDKQNEAFSDVSSEKSKFPEKKTQKLHTDTSMNDLATSEKVNGDGSEPGTSPKILSFNSRSDASHINGDLVTSSDENVAPPSVNTDDSSLNGNFSSSVIKESDKLIKQSFDEASNKSIFSEKKVQDVHANPELLKDCKVSCTKCLELDFIRDRTSVLTEINTNIKLELENVKQELRREMEKNNQLNYEIANIESALEAYHKEAKAEKSTFASIYATMKNYTSSKNGLNESYTFRRIKTIADYMETLKHKLEHQDRIIKNNFTENPYFIDITTKHAAALKQLDEMSKETQELKDEMKRKADEELDIIKELNRQKFQIENKCREIESRYKDEFASKEVLIRKTEVEYKKQLDDFQALLLRKDEDMRKMQKIHETRITNYKQELVIVYKKWKEQKLANKSHDSSNI